MNEFRKIEDLLNNLNLEQLNKLHFRLWDKDLDRNFEKDCEYRRSILVFKIKEELIRVLASDTEEWCHCVDSDPAPFNPEICASCGRKLCR